MSSPPTPLFHVELVESGSKSHNAIDKQHLGNKLSACHQPNVIEGWFRILRESPKETRPPLGPPVAAAVPPWPSLPAGVLPMDTESAPTPIPTRVDHDAPRLRLRWSAARLQS